MTERTSISVTADVRDRVKSLKRGGQTYSELLDKMAKTYEPKQG